MKNKYKLKQNPFRADSTIRYISPYNQRNPAVISVDLYGGWVEAGFPSPAADFLEGKIDLNDHLFNTLLPLSLFV